MPRNNRSMIVISSNYEKRKRKQKYSKNGHIFQPIIYVYLPTYIYIQYKCIAKITYLGMSQNHKEKHQTAAK